MGLNIAQLSRDASAAVGSLYIVNMLFIFYLCSMWQLLWCLNPQGAARRLTTQKKDIEVVESVGVSPKAHFKKTVKYFRAEVKFPMFRIR